MIRKNIRYRHCVARRRDEYRGRCDAESVELDVAQYGGPRSATPGELGTPEVTEPHWWQRAWRRVLPPEAIPDQHNELNQQLAVLEGARAELEAGWVQGSWWAVTAGEGPDHVDGVCLVGALVRAGTGRGTGTGRATGTGRGTGTGTGHSTGSNNGTGSNSKSSENAATGRAVDAVYDALWASRGQPAPARQLVPSPQVRLARVRMLTQWNDRPERTKAEVTTVVDHAISATILALMATPSPATPPPEASAADPASPPDPVRSHPPHQRPARQPPPPPR